MRVLRIFFCCFKLSLRKYRKISSQMGSFLCFLSLRYFKVKMHWIKTRFQLTSSLNFSVPLFVYPWTNYANSNNNNNYNSYNKRKMLCYRHCTYSFNTYYFIKGDIITSTLELIHIRLLTNEYHIQTQIHSSKAALCFPH